MFARIRRPKWVVLGIVWVALVAPLLLGVFVRAGIPSTTNQNSEAAYDLQPVINSTSAPPLVLLVMSRDEQLFYKAYTDYTDLHQGEAKDPGTLNTTYDDTFSYAGYFDPNLCYAYNTSGTGSSSDSFTGLFKADNAATGTNTHSCTSEWSGNFLNWLTMSRLDIVRSVLYGGKRSVDTSTKTVLERAAIPNDLHAWVKIYSGSDIASFTPFSYDASNPVSFCNASYYNNSGNPGSPPELRAARGNWSQWASTERQQCVWNEDANSSSTPGDDPSRSSKRLGGTDFYVRVDVCDETGTLARESFCRTYADTSTKPSTLHYKPGGLLQEYGESGKMRFGLMTGSWADPRSGGRLRRNIGLFAGNGTDPTKCVVGDEVKLSDGTFCNQGTGVDGIVNTINRFIIPGWFGNVSANKSGDAGTTYWGEGDGWRTTYGSYNDCWEWDTISRSSSTNSKSTKPGNPDGVLDNPGGGLYHCNAWGNPLSEIYAEAVRYIEGDGNTASTTPSNFESGDDKTWIPGMPDHVTWIDPYSTTSKTSGNSTGGGNSYCATCSILVLSTGLNSFDSDEIPDITPVAAKSAFPSAHDLTNTVGTDEGLTGNYLIGRVLGQVDPDDGVKSPASLALSASIDTYSDVCSAKPLTGDLGDAIGICPDVPSLEGSYDIAGLAFEAWTNDLRPDLVTSQNKPSTYINKVQTYAVQLAESLPTFNIPVGGKTISFSPVCSQNKDTGKDYTSANYHTCSLGQIQVGSVTSTASSKYIYGRPLLSDDTAGSFVISWEDSMYGSDHDMDVVEVITYCVGSACSYTNGQTKYNTDGKTKYTGYDICWRSTASVCGGSGKPTVGSGEVLIRTEVLAESTGGTVLNGYSLAGTASNDGLNQVLRFSTGGSLGFYSTLSSNDNPPAKCTSNTQSGCWDLPNVVKYTPGAGSVQRLENPLFYAAKYGGFTDKDGNGKPSSYGEWDAANNITGESCSDGTQPCDGLPDNFFPVHNPSLLAQQLGNALNAIIKRTGSGTAAAVVSNSVNGDGLVYRAQYQPDTQVSGANGVVTHVYWTGDLNSLWTDSSGLLREDGNGNAVLDDYSIDPIVAFYTDSTTNAAKFNACVPDSSGKFDATKVNPGQLGDPTGANYNPGANYVTCTAQDLQSLKTVWDAQQQLWTSSGSFASNIDTQRTYSSTSDGGRYIFTWVDKNHNGVVDSGEQTGFVWSGSSTGGQCSSGGFCGDTTSGGKLEGDLGFLNSNSPTEAQNIVDWIRGDEVSGLRSRTIDGTAFGSSSGNVVARLGDIIDSTPLVVGKPAEAYDQLYGDNTYATFKAHYRDRRQVVYVGANDGMLHAFNAGFYSAADQALYKQPHDQCDSTGKCGPDTSITAHPLGGEIWAYVPGNLLPHLRWLTDPSYQAEHVFYVDGSPIATDAKIFTDDGDCSKVASGNQCHPGGWGTILVVPFRMGGGMIQVPTPATDGTAYDPTSCPVANVCSLQTSYSAYLVLDVTDPEQPPTVLAELHPASDDGDGQSFTTSEPAFAVMRNPSSGTPNLFFMFIGSGPTGADGMNPGGISTAVTSNAPLRVFAYDLACLGNDTKPADCGTSATTPLTLAGNKTEFDFTDVGETGKGTDSFAGDLIASDFDLNGRAEAVYFGSVREPSGATSPIEFQGSLYKILLSENTDPTSWTTKMMYDANKPIVVRPTLGLNNRAAPQVYFGTGRLLSKDDLSTTGQQQIFGMIDPDLLPSGDAQSGFSLPLASGDLENVTGVTVCADTTNKLCTYGTVSGDPSGAKTFTDFENLFDAAKDATPVAGKAGFYYNLTASGTSPAERVVSAQALLGGVLITNAYTPSTSVCDNVGTAEEFVMNYKTGTGDPDLATSAGTTGFGFGTDSSGNAVVSSSLGSGLPASPSLHVGTGTGSNGITACTQTSTGAVICQRIATLDSVLSQEMSWREPLDQ